MNADFKAGNGNAKYKGLSIVLRSGRDDGCSGWEEGKQATASICAGRLLGSESLFILSMHRGGGICPGAPSGQAASYNGLLIFNPLPQ
jgi:hypothetical protein